MVNPRSAPIANVFSRRARAAAGSVCSWRGFGSDGQWWPAEIGSPQQGGRVRVYDTGEHRLSGFSQQQGGDRSLTFTSQFGLVRVADLPLVGPQSAQRQDPPPSDFAAPSQTPAAVPPAATFAAPNGTPGAPLATDDILKTIERLSELRRRDVLTEEEFMAKKAELLARL